ncbi:glycosyltransferase involved in cell wall biosynthesis [Actinokineospora baliensis]|uniref:glycosyltransferase family 4 protein n=1 Tax=Actinokineospora baliensis TaxID=547056 RepID=UPI00195F0DF4|nr:glycosyltransferase family 4 protein [Actinokineospora baliensis]MBM7771232.1 glycosyltransferase involved in cell wall biosynthesis [Actinokineospora baliensis]
MRVVALIHFYLPAHRAGSETMLHALLRALVDAGHDAHVVVTSQPEGDDEYTVDGVRVHRAGAGERTVPRLVASLDPDVLLTHHQETPHASKLGRDLGVPVVHVVHNNMHHTTLWLHKRPDLVVFNTWWIRRYYATRHRGLRSVVVHPPVWDEQHAATPGDRVTLVNLNRDKGGLHFYELARRMPDVDFLGVVGGHGAQVIDWSVPNLEIQPQTPDMPGDVWSRTRVLLMPSIYESFGMVAVEAAHSGIPTIAHPTPGLLESLSYAGTFIDRDDTDTWVRTIRSVLESDTWGPLSAVARRRAVELDPRVELAAFVAELESLHTDHQRR